MQHQTLKVKLRQSSLRAVMAFIATQEKPDFRLIKGKSPKGKHQGLKASPILSRRVSERPAFTSPPSAFRAHQARTGGYLLQERT